MSNLTLKDLTAQCAELTTQLHAKCAENYELRSALDDAGVDRASKHAELVAKVQEVVDLEAQLLSVTSVASAINKLQRPAYVAPQWQIDRAAAMAAAKALAMSSHLQVRV